jgi:predicted dienelactone hydrolase
MSYRKQALPVSILLAVLVILFAGGRVSKNQAQNSQARIASELSSGIAPYSLAGPHPVGLQNLTAGGETPLAVTVWYPAADGETDPQTVSYPYEIKIAKPLGTVTFATFAGQAQWDALANLPAGPYPLVILSPGFSIGAAAYGWLAEHLASYGFVVIAPEHREYMDGELSGLWQAVPARPQDILAVLAYADESDGVLRGLVDSERVAVLGHSYGGYTALAAAGARIDTAGLTAHCEDAYAEEYPSAWLCDKLLPHLGEMAAQAGLPSIPEGLWPVWADPRVDAAVALAGDAFFFGAEGLAEIDVPVLAMGGTHDMDSPFSWGTQPTYAHVSSRTKVRVALEGAEHMIFTGPCEHIPFYLRFVSGEFCSDGDWDRAYAHGLVSHFVTAFLLAELKGDVQAASALASDAVGFPAIDYAAQGY